jgi:DNA-binding NtrC family response regulator
MGLRERILLVDDEADFTDNMAKLLRNRGYWVNAVNSGESAIAALQEGDYDVMVLDLKMPGLDGIATYRKALELGLLTKVLLLTAHASINTAIKAHRLGACNYLTKPCEIDELVEKIQGALDNDGGRRQALTTGHMRR